jgi:hypothetical protein
VSSAAVASVAVLVVVVPEPQAARDSTITAAKRMLTNLLILNSPLEIYCFLNNKKP